MMPASAPTTPAYSLSKASAARSKDNGPPPVTPQRLPRSQRHQHQLQNYVGRSPSTTVSTPYTPLSLRSAWSSGSNSVYTTPASAASRKRLGASLSPENLSMDESISPADVANDWRCRSSESGIKDDFASENGSFDQGMCTSLVLLSRHRLTCLFSLRCRHTHFLYAVLLTKLTVFCLPHLVHTPCVPPAYMRPFLAPADFFF